MNNFLEKLAYMDMQRAFGFSLILGVLYYFLLFNDGSTIDQNIQTLKGQIATEEVKKVQTEKAKAQEAQSQEQIAVLRENIRRVSSQMPTTLKGLDVNRVIDDSAVRVQLKVTAKKPGVNQEIQNASAEEIPVDIEMQGTYSQFARFLVDIGSLDQITRVKTFKMRSVDEKRDPTTLKIEATIAGYRSLPPKEDEEGGK
ncbi:MAG: type 4a pilus biogenesis protein PilO [Bdellovibrionia bacterium]